MSDPIDTALQVTKPAGEAMSVSTWINIAAVALRVLHEAPALVNSVSDFWKIVGGGNSPPPHIAAAVDAAVAAVQQQQTT